jgi:hypothetical protein
MYNDPILKLLCLHEKGVSSRFSRALDLRYRRCCVEDEVRLSSVRIVLSSLDEVLERTGGEQCNRCARGFGRLTGYC